EYFLQIFFVDPDVLFIRIKLKQYDSGIAHGSAKLFDILVELRISSRCFQRVLPRKLISTCLHLITDVDADPDIVHDTLLRTSDNFGSFESSQREHRSTANTRYDLRLVGLVDHYWR